MCKLYGYPTGRWVGVQCGVTDNFFNKNRKNMGYSVTEIFGSCYRQSVVRHLSVLASAVLHSAESDSALFNTTRSPFLRTSLRKRNNLQMIYVGAIYEIKKAKKTCDTAPLKGKTVMCRVPGVRPKCRERIWCARKMKTRTLISAYPGIQYIVSVAELKER